MYSHAVSISSALHVERVLVQSFRVRVLMLSSTDVRVTGSWGCEMVAALSRCSALSAALVVVSCEKRHSRIALALPRSANSWRSLMLTWSSCPARSLKRYLVTPGGHLLRVLLRLPVFCLCLSHFLCGDRPTRRRAQQAEFGVHLSCCTTVRTCSDLVREETHHVARLFGVCTTEVVKRFMGLKCRVHLVQWDSSHSMQGQVDFARFQCCCTLGVPSFFRGKSDRATCESLKIQHACLLCWWRKVSSSQHCTPCKHDGRTSGMFSMCCEPLSNLARPPLLLCLLCVQKRAAPTVQYMLVLCQIA